MHYSHCMCPLPSSASIANFISDHPPLSLLDHQCSSMRDLKKLHSQIIKTGLAQDTIAISRVLSFCATSPKGDINYAMHLFSHIQSPNLFTWNTIIRGFANSSAPYQAIALFCQMLYSPIQPERRTFPSLFKAYSQLGFAHEEAQLHGMAIKLGLDSDTYVRNSMISMYAVCGHLSSAAQLLNQHSNYDVVALNSMILGLSRSGQVDDARRLFEKMPTRTSISWNSMLSGYVRKARFQEALDLFHQMQKAGAKPSVHTMVSLLQACGSVGSLQQGQWIHAYIEKKGMEVNVIVATAIIDMYCKCGCVNKALQVFETILVKGLSSWNSMISGMAMHGHGKEAIRLFFQLESSGVRPDDVSFLSILTACNHSGMVEQARYYFTRMVDHYKIKPEMKHYGCMVDILGRAGCIREAEELIRTMPMAPDALVWGSLLSASRSHGNIESAERAAKQIKNLNVVDTSTYILLSNAYATLGRFEDVVNVRRLMSEERVSKEPGCSMIEVNGVVNEFLADSTMHHQARDIYMLLEKLGILLEEAGQTEKIAAYMLDWD